MVTTMIRAGLRDGYEYPTDPPAIDQRLYVAGVFVGSHLPRKGGFHARSHRR